MRKLYMGAALTSLQPLVLSALLVVLIELPLNAIVARLLRRRLSSTRC